MYVARLFALSLVASCSGTALDARAATDASLDAASTSPIEGGWQVTSMRCDGERAIDGATAFFTAPGGTGGLEQSEAGEYGHGHEAVFPEW